MTLRHYHRFPRIRAHAAGTCAAGTRPTGSDPHVDHKEYRRDGNRDLRNRRREKGLAET